MDYEKLYKEALKRANEYHFEGAKQCIIDTLEYIFPKLKEDEDERIRKWIVGVLSTYEHDIDLRNAAIAWLEKQGDTNETINTDEFAQGVLKGAAINLITWIDYNAAEGNMCLSNMECKDIEDALVSGNWDKIYAYIKKKLEKQDEQKPADKVEPKFHKGDWIISDAANKDYRICKITDVKDGNYAIESIYGYKGYNQFDEFDNTYRLWDITKDAKDGDVLVSELCGTIMLYKGIRDNNIQFYCDYDFSNIDVPGDRFAINNGQHYGSVDDSDDWHPATKEQRDFLFSKMKEVGYEWNAENKELKKINSYCQEHCKGFQETGKCYADGDCEAKKNTKTGWSEEDEEMMLEIISDIEGLKETTEFPVNREVYSDEINWIKSLKKRIG